MHTEQKKAAMGKHEKSHSLMEQTVSKVQNLK